MLKNCEGGWLFSRSKNQEKRDNVALFLWLSREVKVGLLGERVTKKKKGKGDNKGGEGQDVGFLVFSSFFCLSINTEVSFCFEWRERLEKVATFKRKQERKLSTV